jgi:hypothetical protein
MADDAGGIYYDPDDWECLSDAVRRAGEDNLYRALREGKLPLLFLVADFDPYHPTGAIDPRTVRPVDVEVPAGLGPSDFGGSQPIKLWKRKRGAWPEHDFAFWVVVSKADVNSLLRPAPRDMSALAAPLRKNRRKKRSPEVERAKIAFDELYPKGDPSNTMVRDIVLLGEINDRLKAKGLPAVKIDAAMRAAGRRVDPH